jgi:hypothetical protein
LLTGSPFTFSSRSLKSGRGCNAAKENAVLGMRVQHGANNSIRKPSKLHQKTYTDLPAAATVFPADDTLQKLITVSRCDLDQRLIRIASDDFDAPPSSSGWRK